MVGDVAAARAAVEAGQALALVSGPLGVIAVGRGRPGMLGKTAGAPTALAEWLVDQAPPTALLLLDPAWEAASADALCAAARSRAGADLPCERGPADLLEPPDVELDVEVIRSQLQLRGALSPAQREAAVDVAVAGSPALMACYREARAASGTAAGRLMVEVAVGPGGAVVETALDRLWGQPDFEACVLDVAGSWVFADAPEGAMLAFPIMFGVKQPGSAAPPSPATGHE